MIRIRSTALLLILTIIIAFTGCTGRQQNNGEPVETHEPKNVDIPVTATELPDLSAKEIADAIMSIFEEQELSPMTRYFYGAKEGTPEYFEPERSGWLITGKMNTDPVMDSLSDYAFYVPKGWYAFEVDVLKLKDSADLSKAIAYLEARQKRQNGPDLEFYNPTDLPLIRNASIFAVGNYAIMLATSDNDKARQVVADLFEGKAQLRTDIVTDPVGEEQIKGYDFSEASEDIVQIPSVNNIDITMLEPESKKDLPPDQITAIPEITVSKYTHNTMFLLGGTCEEGAVIRVRGGTEEINSRSDYGDWLVEVPIDPEKPSTLYLTAEVSGKEESDTVKFIVRPQEGITLYEDSGVFGVVVGNDYFTWFQDCIPTFTGSNLLKENEIENLKSRYARKVENLRSRDLDTEIIILMVPSPMRIYAEHVPSYIQQTDGITLTDQFNEAMKEAGITVIDLRDVMFAHKYDPFKIFHRTDSHWSEYGAYFGYIELMNYIAKKFPDAAPRPASDFEFYNKKVNYGDIYATLGLGRTELKEYSVFVNFKFNPPGGFRNIYNGDSLVIDHNVTGKSHVTESNLRGLNLPTAYIMRDSFCGPIFNFLTDRFSAITWQAMWDYTFDIYRISQAKPDYLIYIINERNIKNIMYE
jgi:hypothetical protein